MQLFQYLTANGWPEHLLDSSTAISADTYEIVKTRESFTPHAKPVEKSYTFGPEWSLAGLDAGGERVDFDKTVPDQISLTVGDGVGSCPILYAWRDEEKRWEHTGKSKPERRRAMQTLRDLMQNSMSVDYPHGAVKRCQSGLS